MKLIIPFFAASLLCFLVDSFERCNYEKKIMRRVIIIFSAITLVLILAIGIYTLMREKKNPNEIVLYGNVDVRLVDISFRVSGKVEKLFYEEGDFVPEGSLMAILEKTPYDSEISQAKANVQSILANLKNAEILLQRRKQAVGIGGVSKEDVDDALAQRNSLFANLNSAKAALNIALDNMKYTEVYAPTDGILLTRVREPGTVVNPGDPVYTLSVSSPVWIRAFVDEPDLGEVYYGMRAEIHTDVKGSPVYTGQVGFISPVAEFTPKTVETTQLRTDLVYRLRIYADNPDRMLLQGMPVTVKLQKNKQAKK
jgi:HlyD family secretion protein